MISRRKFNVGALVAALTPATQSQAVFAQDKRLPKRPGFGAAAPRGAALCIGISGYSQLPSLRTPNADAILVARSFEQIGFVAHTLLDPDLETILLALARFRLNVTNASTAVIYLAGHGGFSGAHVHAFPSSVTIRPGTVVGSLPETALLTAISDKPRQKILLLDCCRTQFSAPKVAAGKTTSFAGSFTCYSAQPGAEAYDGVGENGPFASAVANTLVRPGLTIEEIARIARLDVVRETSGAQIPWSRSSLLSPVILNPRTV